MRQVTCDCGKTLFFGDEEEVQFCDRCGQEVRASGDVVKEAERPLRRSARTSDAARDGAAGRLPPPIDIAAEPLVIASARLGCMTRAFRLVFRLPVLIFALVGVIGYDYYLYPARRLPCGHAAKERFVFDAFRIRHSCPAMKALYYLDRARTAINRELGADEEGDVTSVMLAIVALPGVGHPSADIPYTFEVDKDLSLTGNPADADSELPSFYVELAGTIRAEPDGEAGPASSVAGRFEEGGWIVTPEEEESEQATGQEGAPGGAVRSSE
jgi:hypothetical protein